MKYEKSKKVKLFKSFSWKEITTHSSTIVVVLTVLIYLSIFSGCSASNTNIIGEWRSTDTGEPIHSITFERKGDAVLRDPEGRAVTVFEYKINGDQLTLTDSHVETTWIFVIADDELTISADSVQSLYLKVK